MGNELQQCQTGFDAVIVSGFLSLILSQSPLYPNEIPAGESALEGFELTTCSSEQQTPPSPC